MADAPANSLMLTWNPDTWEWKTFAADFQRIRNGQPKTDEWSCKTSAPQPGDRFYLMKQGREPRGIVASGTVIGETFLGQDAVNGGIGQKVPISIEVLLDHTTEEILDRETLYEVDPRFQFWGVAHSGTTFTPDAAARLERLWNDLLSRRGIRPAATATPARGTGWTPDECRLIVGDYFQMLGEEILGHRYSKTEHRRRLREQLGRSDPSIEFKHANISAVLAENGQPYIDGYKPRGNYQRSLADAVENYLDEHPQFFTRPEMLAAIEPTTAPRATIARAADFFEAPPEILIPAPQSQPWQSRRGRKIDFAVRDAANRQLGKLGEQFALDLERRRLIESGRDDLAARVEWIADTCGDGIGYDVLSFHETTEKEKWLEVKTTGLAKYHPFLVTDLEVRCSEAEPERFNLYRVFDFRSTPRVYILPGALSATCRMDAALYRAAPTNHRGTE